jgi:hypothetical protein
MKRLIKRIESRRCRRNEVAKCMSERVCLFLLHQSHSEQHSPATQSRSAAGAVCVGAGGVQG